MFSLERHFERQILELAVVRLDQVGESGAEPIVVGADQRVQAHQVDVVLDDDQVALLVERIQPAGGVGDDQEPAAQLLHHPDRKGHLPGRVALVEVEPPFHRDDASARPAGRRPAGPCGSRPSTAESAGSRGRGSPPRPRSRAPGRPGPCPGRCRPAELPTSVSE